jgi:hypothetical protein
LTQPVAEEAPVEEVATEEVSTAAKADLTKAVK